jgi:drug/metabolite transporter (DMT)-like permease
MDPAYRRGIGLVLVSALAFGTMAIFAKLAYEHGANTATLLTLRFALAGAVLWVIVMLRGDVRRRLDRRTVIAGGCLGLFGYSLQAGGYFAALQHMDASLTALLLYTYPAMVFIGAVALGREQTSGVKILALGLAAAGLVLVLVGGGAGGLDSTGVLLAFGAALAYATYILVADTIVGSSDTFALTAMVMTGAFVSVSLFTVVTGQFEPGRFESGAWLSLLGLVVVATILAITTFFLGLDRVGPSTASIVSTVEPAWTVALAAIIFGETLGAVQLVGGALVLSAVVVLQLRPGNLANRAAPDHAAPAPAAREAPHSAA